MASRALEMSGSPNMILCTGSECFFDSNYSHDGSKYIFYSEYRYSIIVFKNLLHDSNDPEGYFKNTHSSPLSIKYS